MEKQIKKILDILENNNYEAFLVGGYVRDTLLGRTTYDVDICTNALPKDIVGLFNSFKSNYGSVNLKVDKYNIDITTYRKDICYVKRHPSKIMYNVTLEEDVKRRDFTINAICMDKVGKVIDLVKGIDDLNNRVIRMIGDNIKDRLVEDPLRIMRAIRFATVLDFDIEANLYQALKDNCDLVASLSKMRIKSELDKILLSKNFQKGLDIMQDCGINKILEIEYDNINFVDDLNGMWAQIKVKDIPFTNNEKSNIIKITEIVNGGKINEEVLFNYGLYESIVAGMILNINSSTINKMYKKMPIKTREDINITSKEIKEILGSGKVIGDTYQELIKVILHGKLKNKNKNIKEYLMNRK